MSTSTNGTSATTARQRSGRCEKTAPWSSPPARQAAGGDPGAVDEPGRGQAVGDGDVVVEGVLLVLHPAVEPPAPAALAAAAHVRVDVDDAAVEQRRDRRVPLLVRVDRLVGAVGVHHARRRAVERRRRGAAGSWPAPGVPSADGKDRCSPTYAAGSKPGASLRSSSVRSPVARTSVGPDLRHQVGLVHDDDPVDVVLDVLLVGAATTATRCPRPGRPRSPRRSRSSSGRIRSWLRPPTREVSTTWPA